MISVTFEDAGQATGEVCAECHIPIEGTKYQMILQVGGPMDVKVYDAFLCGSCLDTATKPRTGARNIENQ